VNEWLTGISEWVRGLPWVWPMLETLHFVGMCLLLGVIGLLISASSGSCVRSRWGRCGGCCLGHCRLRDQPGDGSAVRHRRPRSVRPQSRVLREGVVPDHRRPQRGLLRNARRTAGADDGQSGNTPIGFKVAGAVSLFSWFMVLYWGRMLPFIGNAF
jgi:hypothetical protein